MMFSTHRPFLPHLSLSLSLSLFDKVKLVFESPSQKKKKAQMSTKQRKAQEEARLAAQAKKDQLLSELEQDEKKLKKGKFFGLF